MSQTGQVKVDNGSPDGASGQWRGPRYRPRPLCKDVRVHEAENAPDAATPPASRGGAGRRAGLVTIDQAISSGTNVLVFIYVAHALAPIDFGRFSILFLVAALAQGTVRSLISVPLLVHPEDADDRPRALIGSATYVGLAGGLPCLGVGALMTWAGSPLGPGLAVLGACLALLQVHDLGRYLAIGRGTPGRAILLDLLWIVLMVAAFVAVHLAGTVSLAWLMLGWAGSGALAGLWVLAQYGVPLGRELSLDWLRERWGFSWRTLVANLSASAGALIAAALMTLVSTAIAVAAVRASLLLGRVGSAAQQAIGSSALADISREKPDDRGLLRHQRRALLLAMVAAGVNVVVLVFLPDVVGSALLGGVWPLIEPLLLPTGLAVVALSAQCGKRAALLGRREVSRAMVIDIIGTAVTAGSLVAGAALAGATGAVWGLVVGQSLTSALWWVAFALYLRRRSPASEPAAVS